VEDEVLQQVIKWHNESIWTYEDDHCFENGYDDTTLSPYCKNVALDDSKSVDMLHFKMSQQFFIYSYRNSENYGNSFNHSLRDKILLLAIIKNNVDCALAFLKHGCNPNGTNNRHDGKSLLEVGIDSGSIAICRLLLQYGANPDQYNHNGVTPRNLLSSAKKYVNLLQLLQDEYPSITQVDKKWEEYSRRYVRYRTCRQCFSLLDVSSAHRELNEFPFILIPACEKVQ